MSHESPLKPNSSSIKRWGYAVLDAAWAIFIGIYGIIIGPLVILKGPLKLDRFLLYVNVLAPKGLLSEAIRSAIEWRLGHFGEAIMKLENIVSRLEARAMARGKVSREHILLVDFYTLLTRCYLHMGRIDEAMVVVIRAKKLFRRDYLKELVGVDAKTAQLVRAGISAGKLLDGEGLATLFVKAERNSQPAASSAERKGATVKDENQIPDNVVPFRRPEWEK
jgi:hypothetical protein